MWMEYRDIIKCLQWANHAPQSRQEKLRLVNGDSEDDNGPGMVSIIRSWKSFRVFFSRYSLAGDQSAQHFYFSFPFIRIGWNVAFHCAKMHTRLFHQIIISVRRGSSRTNQHCINFTRLMSITFSFLLFFQLLIINYWLSYDHFHFNDGCTNFFVYIHCRGRRFHPVSSLTASLKCINAPALCQRAFTDAFASLFVDVWCHNDKI